MPYFIYQISPDRKLTLLDTLDKFKDARNFARSLRAKQAPEAKDMVRMIFAESPKKAQLLLSDPRSARTDGDD
jgi:hypothetical protein